MNIPTAVVVPVRGELPLTQRLVRLLRKSGGWDRLYVLDNAGAADESSMEWLNKQPDVRAIPAPGRTIYEMWNYGWVLAKAFSQVVNIAFLNNDITFEGKFLQKLARSLRANQEWGVVCPTPNEGSGYNPKAHPLVGFAFMVKGELWPTLIPQFDERYRWWYGDTDFGCEVLAAGLSIGFLEDVPVHHEFSATAKNYPELIRIGERDDHERFVDKWRSQLESLGGGYG